MSYSAVYSREHFCTCMMSIGTVSMAAGTDGPPLPSRREHEQAMAAHTMNKSNICLISAYIFAVTGSVDAKPMLSYRKRAKSNTVARLAQCATCLVQRYGKYQYKCLTAMSFYQAYTI